MESLPKEIAAKVQNMSPEEKEAFMAQRAAALSMADASPKTFEESSGGSVMESSDMTEEELEARRDRQISNQ
ncbi:hypothetical protein KC842_02710 [Candidatus Nomurabacteria bacterium]|nr:hypothetical protein [Candidatus Nomurabacteria bacterium]USN94630.1 MAG: hypothetical protein H6791_02625 [Candidatus Nomurabacteria bacterium]